MLSCLGCCRHLLAAVPQWQVDAASLWLSEVLAGSWKLIRSGWRAVLQLENSYNALLVAVDANQDEELLPPEGFIPAGPITPEG